MFNLSGNKSNWLMLLIMLFAWFVGLYNLGDTRIGADELKTIEVVKDQSPLEALTHYYSYNHIPYAFLLTIIYQFTNKLFILRLVSVTFGVLAVAMTYRLSRSLMEDEETRRRRGGSLANLSPHESSRHRLLAPVRSLPLGRSPALYRWLALAVSLLLAITPIFVRYLREMRGYSATVFLGLVIFFSLWQIVNRLRAGQAVSLSYWLAFVIASALCVYTHFFTVFALVAATLLVIGSRILDFASPPLHLRTSLTPRLLTRLIGDPLLRSFILSLVAIGFLLALLLGPIAPQILAVPSNEELSTPEFGPFMPTRQFLQGFIDIFRVLSPLGDDRIVAYSFLALALGGCWWGWRDPQQRRGTIWLIVWWLTPFLTNLITLNFVPAAQIRYYLFTLPAYLLLGLYGLTALAEGGLVLSRRLLSLRFPIERLFVPVLSVLIVLLAAPRTAQLMASLYELGVGQAWTSVGAYLRAEIQPNDLVLCEAFELPGGDENKCRWQLNDVAKLTSINRSQSIPYFNGIANFRGAEKQRQALQSQGRVWFVLYFRQSAAAFAPTLADMVGRQFGRTWVIRVDSGDNLLENLIITGQGLLTALPDEDHQFRYHLDLSQLYALAGDGEAANFHVEQAAQLQQQSNEPERIPELRTVAALVRFYAPANPTPQYPVNVNFDHRLKLYGYSLEPTTLAVGQATSVKLSFYWQVLAPLTQDYNIFVHLKDAQGNVVSHLDFQPFDAIYPTSYWPLGADLREARQFAIPSQLPPGEYTFAIGLYLPNDLSRLRIVDDVTGENAVSLGQLIIED